MISEEEKLNRELIALKLQLLKKEKVIQVLKNRVKHSIQRSGDAYAIFERNIVLQGLVEQQTKNLHDATDKAEAGSKAKSDFLAQMSHEIRTPLNVITGMSHLLLRTDVTDKQLKYINNIQRSSNALLAIITDVLDVSKIEAGKMELENIEFSIKSVLENVASVFGVKVEDKDIEVLFSVDPAIPEILLGDPLRLSQILNNLCSNAIKFTDKGQIIIRIKSKATSGSKVELQFSVQDSGIGIDKEQADKLFQPFNQADDYITRKYGGTGLGLSISKHLVGMMHGDIWLESEPNIGSTFFFTIEFLVKQPLLDKDRAKKNDNYLLKQMIFAQKYSVLIVDDNDLNLEIIAEMLQDMKLSVSQAKSGKEAIERVQAEHFDLVLMDIQMPEMDGLEATRIIRQNKRLADLPILAMTAHASQYDAQKSIDAGMNEHLTKPIEPTVLRDMLVTVLTNAPEPDGYILNG